MGKGEDTRKAIMNEAVGIFAEKGYSSATTREIAIASGVSEATLFKHFKNKKGLLHETLLEYIDRMANEDAFGGIDNIVSEIDGLSTEELLTMLFKDRFELFDKNYQMLKILLIEIQYHDDVREIFMDRIFNRFMLYAKKLSETMGKREGIRKDISPMVIIRSFMGMVLFTALQKKIVPGLDTGEENVDLEISNMVNLFMKGIERSEEE